MEVLTVVSLLLAALAAACFVLAVRAARGRRVKGTLGGGVAGLLLLLLALLGGAILAGTRGYRVLTREVVAATVTTEPIGPRRFRATFRFPDGRTLAYALSGDQLYVDAHILKWEPALNLLGLHTSYALDRVGGRYESLEDERARPRTVFSPLASRRPFDFFHLVRALPFLDPIVDAEYGSATFVPAGEVPRRLELRVSTSGLLFRPVEGEPARRGGQ